jgi:hypothetical protein
VKNRIKKSTQKAVVPIFFFKDCLYQKSSQTFPGTLMNNTGRTCCKFLIQKGFMPRRRMARRTFSSRKEPLPARKKGVMLWAYYQLFQTGRIFLPPSVAYLCAIALPYTAHKRNRASLAWSKYNASASHFMGACICAESVNATCSHRPSSHDALPSCCSPGR